MFRKLLLLALVSAPAYAQWMTVAKFGQTVTVSPGSLIRYGSPIDNMWDNYKLYLSGKTYTVGGGEFPTNPDPQAVDTTFVLQVYQIPVAQTITVAGSAIPIPAMDATQTAVPQPGTPAYCNSGKAMTAAVNVVISAATGTITSGSMPCN